MSTRNIDKLDLLLSKLDKKQLADFIRKECCNSKQLQDRFLALGAGTLFKPDSAKYASRVEDLIEDYSDRHGYIEYRATFDFNRAVTRILDEADEAMENVQWEVAVAVLMGIASISEDILNSGDDSAGELGAIVSACFEKWHILCDDELLPENLKSEIFDLALSRFKDKDLEGWDWWWDWIEMAITLADTPEKQDMVVKALDAIKSNDNDDNWSAKHNAEMAQKYKLEIMSRRGSEEDQIKFMYDNVSNPDFRKRLIQIAWDKADYDEVLRLAKEGVNHDADYAGLVTDWYRWEYRVYQQIGDRDNKLKLARHFFFNGGRWGEKEFYMDSMYSVLKSLVPQNEWPSYVTSLIAETQKKKAFPRLLYIYTQEKMWSEYMDYIRKDPSIYEIDEAPNEVKKLFREEIIKLYAADVRNYFQRASSRDSYRNGVAYIRKLIRYGGSKEAEQIVIEQKSRTPRRPALIDELSKL